MTSLTLEPGFGSAQHTTRPATRPATRPGDSTAPVHLTRRGRLLVFAVALIAVLAVGMWAFGGTSAATDHPQPTRTVVVGSGETLWDIAADVAPAGRTAATVASIQRLNHLESGMVLAGQRLRVPAGE